MNCEPVKNKLCSERFFIVMNCEPELSKTNYAVRDFLL